MQAPPHSQERSRAEALLDRLAARLSHHALWDTLLLILPPFAAAICVLAVLFRASVVDSLAVGVVAILFAVAGTVATIFRYRLRSPNTPKVAKLADRQSGAKDHFLTLATLPSGNYPVAFISRLRRESSALGDRIEIKRDFPYKIKRSAYASIGTSLLAVLLIYLLAPVVSGANRVAPVQTRLRQVAQNMARKLELKALATQLEALAAKLDDPKTSQQEKEQLAQRIEKQVKEQQREATNENQKLLGEAAGALEGMEQQVASADSRNEQQKGGGGIQSDQPQKGQGESKESQGTDGSKGDSKTESNSDVQKGNTGTAKPNDPGQEKNRQQGETANHNQRDPNQANKDPNKEQAGKPQGGSKEGAGQQQAAEQAPPQGPPPADRLGGEGNQALKGAGYVTVQLPEEIAADGKSESRPSKDSKGGRSRSQVPVSNVPLPAHIPNAAAEKQQVPIEYRGMIR
jgi:hypothetical protein